MKCINGVSQKDVEEKALWAVEIEDEFYGGRYWDVVKGSDLNAYCKRHEGELSDMDWLVFDKQPKELKPFFDWYEAHRSELPFFIKDIFEQYGEDKDWRDWGVGDEVWYHGKDFDGYFEFFGVITQKFGDHLIAEADGMSLWIDDFSVNLFDKMEV